MFLIRNKTFYSKKDTKLNNSNFATLLQLERINSIQVYHRLEVKCTTCLSIQINISEAFQFVT